MIPAAAIIVRRQLRLAAVYALQAAQLEVGGVPVQIQSPGDWDVPEPNLPVIKVRTGHEAKGSILRGPVEVNTTCTLEIKAIVEGETAEEAQDAVEQLWYTVEETLLTDYALLGMCQQIASVESALEFKSEGARHLAGIAAAFRCETFESFDSTQQPLPDVVPPGTDTPLPPNAVVWPVVPPPTVPVTKITTSVDLTNVADPSGTYSNPPFPDSVVPAPRTHGPDGRDEGHLDIPLEGA